MAHNSHPKQHPHTRTNVLYMCTLPREYMNVYHTIHEWMMVELCRGCGVAPHNSFCWPTFNPSILLCTLLGMHRDSYSGGCVCLVAELLGS